MELKGARYDQTPICRFTRDRSCRAPIAWWLSINQSRAPRSSTPA